MITSFKIMDIPRHIVRRLFQDTRFPLIQHHLDSFNDMVDVGIPDFIKASNPFELEVKGDRFVRVYVGGRDGTKLQFLPPTDDDGTAIVPHACRLDDRTYAMTLQADLLIEYSFPDGSRQESLFRDVALGQIPLMLRSKLCYLSALDGYTVGECKYEPGGYFIIDGSEKVLLTQELLGNNMFYAGKRARKVASGTARPSLIQAEAAIKVDASETKMEDVVEFYTGIKTMSEDGARGPYSHFLILPSPTVSKKAIDDDGVLLLDANMGRDNRLATIQLSGYQNPVPVISLFRALGVSSDRDLYETILAGVSDKDRLIYDNIFQELVLSHEKYLRETDGTDLDVLANQTRNKTKSEVVLSIYNTLFSHVEGPREGILRRKAYLLGKALKMAMDVAIGRTGPSDRDNMQFKRMKTSGVLMMEEFRRAYREVGKEMLTRMDKKHTYETAQFAGKNLVNIVQPENVYYFWRKYMMLNTFVKSFKGMWGDRVGISQELMRPSYISVLHHLRKTDLQIDKTASTAPPRRLYASQFGIMCPLDSPDGSDIGYKKALALLARVTTAFPAEEVKKVLRETGVVREIADVHPSTLRPESTPIYINSDWVGVCIGNTEDLHARLLQVRRSGKFPIGVTLAWNRLNNQYTIYCDAGRPIRPVYRPGTTPEMIRAAKSWTEIEQHLDFMDASESDTVRISLTPFHPTLPSEIHMSLNLSPIANLVPYSDHNPATRDMFSIAQQKSAASIYHTNYKKRFDTNAMLYANPQKPLSQTWMYNQIMGQGGCLGYGENALVAFTMYGGNNQEDSVILNGGSIRRGMGRMMYYHSYSVTEEMLNEAMQTHTEIGNPLEEGAVRRREGYDYSQLDEDGIIRVGAVVTEDTVLVSVLSPIVSANGRVTGFRDASLTPKRGQHGRVDAVYRFATSAGLRGVRVRVIEDRAPTIGDKMASRHSQKGTVGMILPEEDMPFLSTGVRPDLIFNPHGIPTRMTVGQFLEAASNKLGLDLGSFVDATPFSTTNRIGDLRVALLNRGFHPYGHETLYNGQTGEMMDAEIFMGPIYYQRLKQMVEDKINYRDRGPMTLMTHQPVQGRDNEGGLRIGEMERDSLMCHGMSKFLTESMMERSDKETRQFNKEEGRFDTSRDTLDVPYSMALFTQELESLHVKVEMKTIQ